MIGEALRLIRVYHDKKLTHLARELKISPGFLSEVETNKRRPNLKLIEKYANIFNLEVSSIMFFNEQLDSADPKFKTPEFFRKSILKFLQFVEKVSNDSSTERKA